MTDKLCENIRHMRMMRGFSQKQLAERIGRSANAVSNWEKGSTLPDVELLENLCTVLGVTPNQIYGWDPCPELDEFLKKQETILKTVDDLMKQRDEINCQIREYAYQLRAQKFRNSNDL